MGDGVMMMMMKVIAKQTSNYLSSFVYSVSDIHVNKLSVFTVETQK